jgi:hypothetical protein
LFTKLLTPVLAALLTTAGAAFAQPQALITSRRCEVNSGLCTERADNRNSEGEYIGHDEPSLLFYSNRKGSGNSSVYKFVLPKDPPLVPTQDGKGGTWNFQLHPTFWLGMALCDSESFPEFTKVCKPDTDDNIFDNPSASAKDYIGKHPGSAFMELQFYPPGWVTGFDATRYAAAINIFSFLQNGANNKFNNDDCRMRVGDEPGNFALIQKNGIPPGPADPLNQNVDTSLTPDAHTLWMNPGDTLIVAIFDTDDGMRVNIQDITTGDSGFMVAGKKSTFGQIVYDPAAATCAVRPYDFHPMYATSGEHTRVPWAAHSYNIAFSDEIGHFEFCNSIDGEGGNCTVPGVQDAKLDDDDTFCFSSLLSPLIKNLTGCIGTEFDFDGTPYQATWPGSIPNPTAAQLARLPSPIRFSSPLFVADGGDGGDGGGDGGGGEGGDQLQNFDRVAFEADLPAIENATVPACDTATGAHCVNPPQGAAFYPIFSTFTASNGTCSWQFGGAHMPGTVNNFGGTSASEFGTAPLALVYQVPLPAGSEIFFEDFRSVLNSNPCQAVADVDLSIMKNNMDNEKGGKGN